MFGMMVESLLVTGLITRCMVKASLLGQMVDHMRESILMIKSKDLDCLYGYNSIFLTITYFIGLMAKNITENGGTVVSTDKESLNSLMDKKEKENGEMVKELDG
jgi:hypothetical protein